MWFFVRDSNGTMGYYLEMHPQVVDAVGLFEHRFIWGFHSHGWTPIAGWFIIENPMKIDDCSLFQEETSIVVRHYILPNPVLFGDVEFQALKNS